MKLLTVYLVQSYKKLKDQKKDLKVLVAVGGTVIGSTIWSKMSASESTRRVFIDSTVASLKLYGLDGINLCWIYPGYKEKNGVDSDKENFLYLLKVSYYLAKKNCKLLNIAGTTFCVRQKWISLDGCCVP